MAAHAVTSVGDKLQRKRECVRLAFSRDVDANLGIHDESLGAIRRVGGSPDQVKG